MSYYVTITRKKYWPMPDGPVITADEWLSYVATDPQLKPISGSNTHRVNVDIPPGYSSRELSWSSLSGCILTNKPDAGMLAKMLQIASALGGKVQGEDGEIYGVTDLHDGFFSGKSVLGLDLSEPKSTG
jgi:hypothetical protein